MSAVKNVAILGANGTVGTFITESLLATGKHTVTALTRNPNASAGSGSKGFPSSVKLATIDYNNPSTIVSTLKGQDCLIITMGVQAPPDTQLKLIDAAAEAGVPYVMTNDWGFDPSEEQMAAEASFSKQYGTAHERVEKGGVSSWISMVCGFWYEWSLGLGLPTYGIDALKKEAVLLDGGETKMNTSTWPMVGRAVAALLSLPAAELAKFKNDYVRVSSFTVSQKDMLASVLRVTGTKEDEWKITHEKSAERYAAAAQEVQKGNFAKFSEAMYSRVLYPDGGCLYETKGLHNDLLGLPKEDLDEATKTGLARAHKGGLGYEHENPQ